MGPSLLAMFAAAAAAPTLLPAQSPPDLDVRTAESAADKVAWIGKNAVAFRTIDPKDENFTDLGPLRRAIGSARFVLLGGSGDVAVAFAKYRLVRFLHEEMGFNVLACNASFFDAEETDRALDGKAAPHRQFFSGFEQIFGYNFGQIVVDQPGSNAIDILGYARATRGTGNALHISGFRNAAVGSSFSKYVHELFRFIDGIDPALAPPADREAIGKMLAWQNLTASRRWPKTVPPGLEAVERLDERLARLPANGPDVREISFYRLTLRSVAAWAGPRAGRLNVVSPDPLYWYAGVWRPNSKIVVWSNNTAVERNLSKEQAVAASRFHVPLIGADAIAQALGSTDYSIAFTEIKKAAEALDVLVAGPRPSLSPFDDSFESLLQAAHLPYSFIDFRALPQDHWLRRPLTARFTPGEQISAIWPDNYDAIIGIDLTALKSGHPAGVPR